MPCWKANSLFVAFLAILLFTVACGGNAGVVEQTAETDSALMLGQPGIPGRTDQFVRSGGVLYWRYTEGDDRLATSQHDYVYIGNRGVSFITDPAAASWGTGRADVFVVNQNYTIDHGGLDPSQNGFAWWDNWGSPVPGLAIAGVAVSSGRYGLLDLFAVTTSAYNGVNSLYHRRWDNGYDTGWVYVGASGQPSYFGGPAAVSGGSNGTESFDVFVRGYNSSTGRYNIYHLSSPTGGGIIFPWENLGDSGATLSSKPTAASWGNGRMDVLVTDTAGVMRHIFTGACTGSGYYGCYQYQWYWNTWGSPPVNYTPAIVAMGPNNLRIFARFSTNGPQVGSLEQCGWENGDLGCKNRGGYIDGGPAATSWGLKPCSPTVACTGGLVCVSSVCVQPSAISLWQSSVWPYQDAKFYTEELQGLAHDNNYLYMTQHWNIMRFNITDDLHGNPQLWYSNPWGSQWSHLGALTASPAGLVYVPLEPENGSAPRSAIGIFNSNLAYYGAPTLPTPPAGSGIPDEQAGRNGACSWLAYNPKNGKIYSSAYSNPGWIYAYNVNQSPVWAMFDSAFQIRDANGNAARLTNVQGGSFSDSGKLYLITTNPGYVYMLDPYDGRIQNTTWIEEHPGCCQYEELEALMVWDTTGRAPYGWSGQVHVLLLDQDSGQDDFYVKHYTASGPY